MFSLSFNSSQLRIIESPLPSRRFEGGVPASALLVVAGPGTGKTRTLTARIAWLVRARGVDPSTILALTFTNRAAGEMRSRIASLAGKAASEEMFIGTFHSLGLFILREEWSHLGFAGPVTVLGEEEQRDLLESVAREKEMGARKKTIRLLVKTLEEIAAGTAGPETPRSKEIAEILFAYGERKKAECAADFMDLILLPIALFKDRPDRLAFCRSHWRHILVDEYQDVNASQVALVKLLAGGAMSLVAIGDPDQSIYSFRGSAVEHFYRFKEDFPGAEVVHLEENYRSTETILSASGQVIGRNRSRPEEIPEARATKEKGLRIEMRRLPSDRAEAAFVARRIEELLGGLGRFGPEGPESGGGPPSGAGGEGKEEEGEEYGFGEIAVLYRLNAQAPGFAAAMEKAGIPFQRIGTGRLGRDEAFRAVLALARLALREEGEGLAPPPHHAPSRRVLESFGLEAEALADGLFRAGVSARPEAFIEKAGALLAAALPEKAKAFRDAAAALAARLPGENPPLAAFLAAAPLLGREDPFLERSQKVTLSTIHAAKGLEFPVVFITGLEEGIVPFEKENEERDREALLEEERRLLYVGMTRARSRLVLTSASRRFLFGKTRVSGPSPFLEEISGDLVHFVRGRKRKEKKTPGGEGESQMRLF